MEFLKEKYTDSKDINTSMTLLNALYNYGAQGQAVFKQLEACCDSKDKLQFKHIQDPLTNDRAYEL